MGGAWGANSHLYLDQTEARRAETFFFNTAHLWKLGHVTFNGYKVQNNLKAKWQHYIRSYLTKLLQDN